MDSLTDDSFVQTTTQEVLGCSSSNGHQTKQPYVGVGVGLEWIEPMVPLFLEPLDT